MLVLESARSVKNFAEPAGGVDVGRFHVAEQGHLGLSQFIASENFRNRIAFRLSSIFLSIHIALSVRLYLLSSVIIVRLKSRILDTSFLSLVPTRVSDPYAHGSACFCPVRIRAKREREGMNKS